MVLHVFTSFLGGVPLCIPYGLYSGTSLGGTTREILGGFLGRVLSILLEFQWYELESKGGAFGLRLLMPGLISPSLGTSPLLLSELGCNSRLDVVLVLCLLRGLRWSRNLKLPSKE